MSFRDIQTDYLTIRKGSLFETDLIVDGNVDISGRVGIGDPNPGTVLQISGSEPYLTLKNTNPVNNEGGAKSKIIFEDHNNNSLAQIQASHDGSSNDSKGDLIFSTNSDTLALTERMRIDSSGNVGIGTTNPQSKLHISSDISGVCELILEADTDNNDNNEDDNPRILFRQDGGHDWSMIGNGDNYLILANSVTDNGGILFKTGTTDGYTNAAERMRIDSSGNVGIGTTSPTHKLEVIGNLHVHGDITTTGSGVGMVSFFVGTTIPNTGWLECNGTLLSQSTYPELFSRISTTYGGNSTHFNLPDFRGYFLRCWHNGTSTGPSPSDATTNLGQAQSHNTYLPVHKHTATSDQAPHSHQANIPRDQNGDGNANALVSSGGDDEGNALYGTTSADPFITTVINDSTQYPSGSNESRPHNYSLLCCIRYE